MGVFDWFRFFVSLSKIKEKQIRSPHTTTTWERAESWIQMGMALLKIREQIKDTLVVGRLLFSKAKKSCILVEKKAEMQVLLFGLWRIREWWAIVTLQRSQLSLKNTPHLYVANATNISNHHTYLFLHVSITIPSTLDLVTNNIQINRHKSSYLG